MLDLQTLPTLPEILPPNPLAFATLPPSRAWLVDTSCGREGLYLSQVLDSPQIFISDVASAGDPTLLARHNIGAIVSFVTQPFERLSLVESPATFLDRYRVADTNCGAYREANIARYYLKLTDDGKNSSEQLVAAFDLLQEVCRTYQDTPILVHCNAGLSRSVALVTALVAKSQKFSFQEAALLVSQHRQIGINEDLARPLCDVLGIDLDQKDPAGI